MKAFLFFSPRGEGRGDPGLLGGGLNVRFEFVKGESVLM